MSEEQKNSCELMEEFPAHLSPDPECQSQLVSSIIGENSLYIDTVEEGDKADTRAILLELSPEAASRLAEISRIRSREYRDTLENNRDYPFNLKHFPAEKLGVRARLLDAAVTETELCISPDRAAYLKASEIEAERGFHIWLDFRGDIVLCGYEPDQVSISVFLDARMLQQMAEWRPEESAGCSPSLC